MKTLIATSIAAITLAVALPADARDGNSSLRDFKKWTAEAREAGGYGNPVSAMIDAMTDKKERKDMAKEYGAQSSKGARGYTGGN
ncbi:MAG: hypothetical protein AAF371_18890 [Pseudomonadota bacterium]